MADLQLEVLLSDLEEVKTLVKCAMELVEQTEGKQLGQNESVANLKAALSNLSTTLKNRSQNASLKTVGVWNKAN